MFFRFFLLIFFPVLAFSTMTLNDAQVKYDNFSISYFYDEAQTLSIDEIAGKEFHDTPNQFSFGYLEGDAWFKISLNNNSQTDAYVLYFTEPLWEKFDFYEEDGRGGWKVIHAGLLTALQNRQIKDVNPAFYLDIPHGETKTFYVNGKSVSAQIGEFQIYAHDEYFRPTRLSITAFYNVYLVLVIIFAFFNLYLLIASRDLVYAYYIGYLVAFGIWLSTINGIYLALGFRPWNHGLHASGTLVVIFLVLFSSAYLELKKHYPRIEQIFNYFALIFGLYFVLITFDVPFASLLFNITSSVFFSLLLAIAVKVWLDRPSKVRYYLLALVIYMPTMAAMTLVYNGLIENDDITRYAFVFGSFVEILFFNSLMISRYNAVFNEKITIQNELIKEKEKNEQYLRSEIGTYVQELQMTNARLLAQTLELEKTQKMLTEEATVDMLSKLYNRRYFEQISHGSFHAAKRYGHNLSVLILDIDNFKEINDTYGHPAGDEVIAYYGNTLKQLTRSSDIAARYGGDEFVILVPHTGPEEALELAHRICSHIEHALLQISPDTKIQFTTSIGISHMNAEQDSKIDQIISRADKALYTAKANGKNQVVELP